MHMSSKETNTLATKHFSYNEIGKLSHLLPSDVENKGFGSPRTRDRKVIAPAGF